MHDHRQTGTAVSWDTKVWVQKLAVFQD